jgi:uncharacterized protein (TIGR04222 family)
MVGFAAAEGDTWGISGPDFLQIYLMVSVALVILASLNRYLANNTGASITAQSHRSRAPEEVSYLSGGPRLAVIAALAALRVTGAVDATRGRLRAVGPVPPDAGMLAQAVHDAASRGVHQKDLIQDYRVAARLDLVRESLESAGLLLGEGRRRRARLGAYALLALTLLGLVRLGAGLANGRPVGWLVVLVIVTGIVTVLQFRLPLVSAEGRNLVRRARTENAHLSPSYGPSATVYGVTGAAMAVALYGSAAMWASDPAFAAEAEIQRKQQESGYAGAGGGGGDSGGSGGDGGGGGGGCGGGGCGGCGG